MNDDTRFDLINYQHQPTGKQITNNIFWITNNWKKVPYVINNHQEQTTAMMIMMVFLLLQPQPFSTKIQLNLFDKVYELHYRCQFNNNFLFFSLLFNYYFNLFVSLHSFFFIFFYFTIILIFLLPFNQQSLFSFSLFMIVDRFHWNIPAVDNHNNH